ncbi:MAG: peptidylprolyl isomerase [Pseudomonadota bacterium]
MSHTSFHRWRALAASAALCTASYSHATVVEVQTVLGNFEINLFDETTPLTVANFLDYVNNGAYTDSIVHRTDPGFVIQGGGFTYDGALPFDTIPANDPVMNEPELSNRRGTIAMAKLGGDANSATTQWFINLSDNQGNLDSQNSGFTVFGIVLGDGMDVVDAIGALPRFNFGGAFGTLPLRDYTDTTMDPDEDNIVIVNAIVVTDSTVSTNTDLLPPVNVAQNPPPSTTPPADNNDGGGGGGAGGAFAIGALGWFVASRRRRASSV